MADALWNSYNERHIIQQEWNSAKFLHRFNCWTLVYAVISQSSNYNPFPGLPPPLPLVNHTEQNFVASRETLHWLGQQSSGRSVTRSVPTPRSTNLPLIPSPFSMVHSLIIIYLPTLSYTPPPTSSSQLPVTYQGMRNLLAPPVGKLISLMRLWVFLLNSASFPTTILSSSPPPAAQIPSYAFQARLYHCWVKNVGDVHGFAVRGHASRCSKRHSLSRFGNTM